MKSEFLDSLVIIEEEGNNLSEVKSCIFSKVRDIFSSLLPGLTLHICCQTNPNFLECERDDQRFPINALSEGEKSILYYSMSVLFAKENSFIVVDEPETFLNPSLLATLWDKLISYREDCKFIFITHSIDFMLTRENSKVFWIKNYVFPNKWEFKEIEDNFLLPKELTTEILGSRKPILFCEGDNKSSLDYRVYNALFGDKYSIIPLGSHHDVIKYCKVLNSLDWINISSVGLIDGDNVVESSDNTYNQIHVYRLLFNEIEMFLFCDEIVQFVMEKIFPDNCKNKVNSFKNDFFDLAKSNSSAIALTCAKELIDDKLERTKIRKYKTSNDIKESLNDINNIDVDSIVQNKEKKLIV